MAREDRPANPFAALEKLRAALPAGRSADARATDPEAAPVAGAAVVAPAGSGPARAVVRMERKGRAGKEVTVVEQLGLDAGALQAWLGDLKRALGCGGRVDGDALVLQGDQRARLEGLLRARGVRRVSVSG